MLPMLLIILGNYWIWLDCQIWVTYFGWIQPFSTVIDQ